jgi:hypothetical protein
VDHTEPLDGRPREAIAGSFTAGVLQGEEGFFEGFLYRSLQASDDPGSMGGAG